MKYYNLTQTNGTRNCYFRSTDVEQKNWRRLLWSVPDEFLYFWSIGKEVVIIDKSTKPRNKIEKIFVPVLVDLLNFLYFKKRSENVPLLPHFKKGLIELENDRLLFTKFYFWRKRIKKIRIKAITIKIPKEIPFR